MVTALDLIAEGHHPDRADQMARIANGGDGCVPETTGDELAHADHDSPIVGPDELAEFDELDEELP